MSGSFTQDMHNRVGKLLSQMEDTFVENYSITFAAPKDIGDHLIYHWHNKVTNLSQVFHCHYVHQSIVTMVTWLWVV